MAEVETDEGVIQYPDLLTPSRVDELLDDLVVDINREGRATAKDVHDPFWDARKVLWKLGAKIRDESKKDLRVDVLKMVQVEIDRLEQIHRMQGKLDDEMPLEYHFLMRALKTLEEGQVPEEQGTIYRKVLKIRGARILPLSREAKLYIGKNFETEVNGEILAADIIEQLKATRGVLFVRKRALRDS